MFLGLLLTSWLVLAKSATLATRGTSNEQPPPPASFDGVLQEQVRPEKIPMEFFLQKEVDLMEGFDLPMQVLNKPAAPFNPRGVNPHDIPQIPWSNLVEFPPARPSSDNIANICSEGRRKLSYGPWNLPRTSFSHLSRQGEALNELEAGVKACCQLGEGEKLPCCVTVWEKILVHYCGSEFSTKTRPHECCLKENRFACFAKLAPFPAYDKEIPSVSLAGIDSPLLDTLCGQFTALSKEKQIPSLIQNITESCCQLQGSERIQCAKDAKSRFVTILCTSQRNTWKDPQRCCAQVGDAPRETCFGSNYLSAVPLASVETPVPLPTEMAIEIPTE